MQNVAFFGLPSVSIWRYFIRAPHRFLVIDAQQCYNLTGSESSDTSDGRNLMPEPSQNADPAVTAEQTESSQAADTIDSASAGSSNTCEKLADPVDRYVPALLCGGKLPEQQAQEATQSIVVQM
ncbi:MAG: hypothetical protein ILA17_11525 [Ruminococcus sp.]|nr:hypothetical protein [Ruminococcus sp.]